MTARAVDGKHGGDADQRLRHPTGSTDIYIGQDATERALPHLNSWTEGRRVFLVSSAAIGRVQPKLLEQLAKLGRQNIALEVPDGESAKSIDTAQGLWHSMLDAAGRRDSRLIAVGGGTVCDLGGFVAATFLRGIEMALVPTTLLAQVDASIGGKTAIDMPQAKNSVGAFWHPAFVVADTGVLASLDSAEIRSGLVEVVKIAAADDADLFRDLETRLLQDGADESESLATIVRRAVEAKLRVVESDPTESDRRRVLNLGHTLGHAIEASLGYHGLRHGEAVAYGVLFALRLALERGCDTEFAARCAALLAQLEPPPLPDLDRDDLLAAIERDKKARRGGVFWVLPMAPGRVEILQIDRSEIGRQLDAFLVDAWKF